MSVLNRDFRLISNNQQPLNKNWSGPDSQVSSRQYENAGDNMDFGDKKILQLASASNSMHVMSNSYSPSGHDHAYQNDSIIRNNSQYNLGSPGQEYNDTNVSEGLAYMDQVAGSHHATLLTVNYRGEHGSSKPHPTTGDYRNQYQGDDSINHTNLGNESRLEDFPNNLHDPNHHGKVHRDGHKPPAMTSSSSSNASIRTGFSVPRGAAGSGISAALVMKSNRQDPHDRTRGYHHPSLNDVPNAEVPASRERGSSARGPVGVALLRELSREAQHRDVYLQQSTNQDHFPSRQSDNLRHISDTSNSLPQMDEIPVARPVSSDEGFHQPAAKFEANGANVYHRNANRYAPEEPEPGTYPDETEGQYQESSYNMEGRYQQGDYDNVPDGIPVLHTSHPSHGTQMIQKPPRPGSISRFAPHSQPHAVYDHKQSHSVANRHDTQKNRPIASARGYSTPNLDMDAPPDLHDSDPLLKGGEYEEFTPVKEPDVDTTGLRTVRSPLKPRHPANLPPSKVRGPVRSTSDISPPPSSVAQRKPSVPRQVSAKLQQSVATSREVPSASRHQRSVSPSTDQSNFHSARSIDRAFLTSADPHRATQRRYSSSSSTFDDSFGHDRLDLSHDGSAHLPPGFSNGVIPLNGNAYDLEAKYGCLEYFSERSRPLDARGSWKWAIEIVRDAIRSKQELKELQGMTSAPGTSGYHQNAQEKKPSMLSSFTSVARVASLANKHQGREKLRVKLNRHHHSSTAHRRPQSVVELSGGSALPTVHLRTHKGQINEVLAAAISSGRATIMGVDGQIEENNPQDKRSGAHSGRLHAGAGSASDKSQNGREKSSSSYKKDESMMTDAEKLYFSRKARTVEYKPKTLEDYKKFQAEIVERSARPPGAVNDASPVRRPSNATERTRMRSYSTRASGAQGSRDADSSAPTKAPVGYYELGRLGPDLESKELQEKRASRAKSLGYARRVVAEARGKLSSNDKRGRKENGVDENTGVSDTSSMSDSSTGKKKGPTDGKQPTNARERMQQYASRIPKPVVRNNRGSDTKESASASTPQQTNSNYLSHPTGRSPALHTDANQFAVPQGQRGHPVYVNTTTGATTSVPSSLITTASPHVQGHMAYVASNRHPYDPNFASPSYPQATTQPSHHHSQHHSQHPLHSLNTTPYYPMQQSSYYHDQDIPPGAREIDLEMEHERLREETEQIRRSLQGI